jgi:murein DD-endopeptidase MepM/ murein hydrolase activator NlpD
MRCYLLALCVALCLTSVAWAAPDLRAAPRTPRPGEAVFITLTAGKELASASCAWRGKSYDFLPIGTQYQVVLPVPAEAKAGAARAKVTWEYAEGECGARDIGLTIRARKFGVQHLKLAAKQERKYEAPETEREYRLIGQALGEVTPEARWQGSFLMPVQGRVSTSYGLQRYVNGHFSYRHKGMDLAAPQGTPVQAAADGVVSLADDSFLLHGQTIIVDHGQGVATLYLHLSEIDVAPGESVARGQVIGRVGATGAATGPHLHYGVYLHHVAMDPVFWTHLPAR